MSRRAVTVAIPVRDGGALLARTLTAVGAQTVEHELLVCDSGSVDASVALAHAHGARVLEVEPQSFNHGGSRNLLIREAEGSHVALLSQDAEPADERWLERLLGGFDLDAEVALVYGPYLPRPDAALPSRQALDRWFASISPDGSPRIDRLEKGEQSVPVAEFVGRRGFFTDANACIAREAWARVPFRPVPYAEDRALAIDMLRAGYAKVFVPDAAVLHSHAYGMMDELRRGFDEWRGLREVYGWREPARPGYLLRRLRGELAITYRELSLAQASPSARASALAAVGLHQAVRMAGAILGSRADVLPPWARRRLSLEHRGSFCPLDLDQQAGSAVAGKRAS
jgi:GT2 family glycosyltransferase